MFFFANNEYRTRCRAHDALGCAADAKMLPAGVAVGRDDDQVGVAFLRKLNNFVRRHAGPDCRPDAGNVSVADVSRNRTQSFFRARKIDLRKNGRNRGQTHVGRFQNVKESEFRAELFGATAGEIQSILRCRRKIDRRQDFPETQRTRRLRSWFFNRRRIRFHNPNDAVRDSIELRRAWENMCVSCPDGVVAARAISAQTKPSGGESAVFEMRRISSEGDFYGLRGCVSHDGYDRLLRLHSWARPARNGVEVFTVKLDQSANALSIAYGGHVTPDETHLCSEEVRRALAILQPGYRLVVDLTQLDAMDLSCSRLIANIMEMCNAAGVAEVIRIIPDPTRDIGLQILSFFHYDDDVYIRTCASSAEAKELLENSPLKI